MCSAYLLSFRMRQKCHSRFFFLEIDSCAGVIVKLGIVFKLIRSCMAHAFLSIRICVSYSFQEP